MTQKQVQLSLSEVRVLKKLNNEQLRLLTEFKDMKQFHALLDMANAIVDINKNELFAINEASISAQELAVKHAYLRGLAAGGVTLLRLVQGASAEILRREETARRTKQEALKK